MVQLTFRTLAIHSLLAFTTSAGSAGVSTGSGLHPFPALNNGASESTNTSAAVNNAIQALTPNISTVIPAHVESLPNWSGGLLNCSTPQDTFTSVSGVFQVPIPQIPSTAAPGYSSSVDLYSGAAWVGLDNPQNEVGDLVQAGVGFGIYTNNSEQQYSYSDSTFPYVYWAWYQWKPGSSMNFTNITVHGGDTVNVTVERTSSTVATFIFENMSSGQSQTLAFAAPNSTYDIQGATAEWIVEDYNYQSSQDSFCDFGNVTFTSCCARTQTGEYGVNDILGLDIELSSGQYVANATLKSSTSIEVQYLSPVAASNLSSSSYYSSTSRRALGRRSPMGDLRAMEKSRGGRF